MSLQRPGLHALKTNIDRLKEDHENAKMLAEAIEEHTPLSVVNTVETNIIMADTTGTGKNSGEWLSVFKNNGIQAGAMSPTIIRFTTHLDLSKEDVQNTIDLLKNL